MPMQHALVTGAAGSAALGARTAAGAAARAGALPLGAQPAPRGGVRRGNAVGGAVPLLRRAGAPVCHRRPLRTSLPAAVLVWACASAGLSVRGEFPTVDVRGLVASNDVVYLSPAREGWEGLPLGNGRLGVQAWQPGPLQFQFNTPLSGVYGGALCRLQVRAAPDLLSGLERYCQRLSLYEAELATEITTVNGTVSAGCFIPADVDAFVLEVADTRQPAGRYTVELEAWRTSATRTVDGDTVLVTDSLKLAGEPDYRYAVVAAVDGPPAKAGTVGPDVVSLEPAGSSFRLWLGVAATRDPTEEVVTRAKARLATFRAAGGAALRGAHRAWWARFWDASYLRLDSPDNVGDYVTNLWYLHQYAMAAGSRGEVPPKFNGGLWTHNRDEREWGAHYWHWNTQETYWPLFAANHLDLHRPYQEMYWSMLPAVESWTKAFWTLDGAQYQETIPFNGVMPLWERENGVHPRVPVPKVVAHTNLILSTSAEIAMQFWWVWLYTGDREFLRSRAYPLMKEVASFYLGYLEKGAAGRYHVWPSNAHESFWKVKNPATDLAAIRYLLPALLDASKRLAVDPELRPVWQECLANLAPYPVNPNTGAILPYELQPGEEMVWRNAENPELFPIGVFPLIRLGTPEYALGVKTFQARRNVNGYGWTTDSIAAARLGLAESAARDAPPQHLGLAQLLPLHAEYYQNYPCGLQDYYGRKPGMHIYLEGSGTLATGVNEMLLQSWDGLIQVCPALPKAWAADFRLLAMGGFEVAVHAEAGRARQVVLRSQRGEPVALVNPFATAAVVRCEGKSVLESADAVLRFPTDVGAFYTVLPADAAATVLFPTATAVPNAAPKRLSPGSRRWIGKPEPASRRAQLPPEPDAPSPPPRVERPDRAARPEATPASFAKPPVIDGELNEDVWATTPALGPFFRLATPGSATEQTDVRLGCDERTLYLGVTCWESRMPSLLADYEPRPENRDAQVFQDDSFELFLVPMPGACWHLAVNALGAVYDAFGLSAQTEDPKLNPTWTVATALRCNRWTVEAAIPFESVAPAAPVATEPWRFNVCRNEKPSGELSTWAPLAEPAFHRIEEFGVLRFSRGAAAGPPESVPDPDLVAHWTFDGASGVWLKDASGHRHFGLLTSTMNRVAGRLGEALEFTGAGFVNVASAPDLDLTDAFTLAAWVNPKTTGSMRILDKGPAGGADAYLLDTHPQNHLRVILRPTTLTTSEPVLPVGQWTHVAATLGNDLLRVYADGTVVSETKVRSGTSVTELPLRLGADSQGANRFSGLMDEVRLYRRVLSDGEIRVLANPGRE